MNLQYCPAMVRCGESPRNATFSVRTPKTGLLYFPKINVMIKKVETENGECWAIVLHPTTSLDGISELQTGLIDIMIDATSSDLFHASQNEFYNTLAILRDTILTPEQMHEYEQYLKQQKA